MKISIKINQVWVIVEDIPEIETISVPTDPQINSDERVMWLTTELSDLALKINHDS